MPSDQIQYSDKYSDGNYEYRHVILPPDISKQVPRTFLMTETEWRNLGVQQSPGWVHFMIHNPGKSLSLLEKVVRGVPEGCTNTSVYQGVSRDHCPLIDLNQRIPLVLEPHILLFRRALDLVSNSS